MSVSSAQGGDDQFIPGVYNYCDSWCSACVLAARCRVKAEMDAEWSPAAAEGFAAQVQTWFTRALELTKEHARDLGIDLDQLTGLDDAPEEAPSPVSLDHARLISRAKAYGHAVFSWQRRRPPDLQRGTELDPSFPQDVIDHFAFLIVAKVQRAISALTFDSEGDGCATGPRDSDGSAKVALLAAERSRAAWSDLRDSGLVDNEMVASFEEGLAWLIGELDRVFPDARRFVRPGFDE